MTTVPVGGRPFGRYVLLEDLGRGGMAVVSKAVIAGPRGFSRTVVIKRILAEYAQQQSFINMLATEARLSAMLTHPGIVQVHEFGDVDGEFFLAMEHVDGTDLLQLMKNCAGRRIRLPVGAACHLVASVAHALAYAHSLTDADGVPLEIVHRDVSPSNIMVTPLGEVKLLDFGIAKAAAHVRDEHTTTGTLKGKISYLSPEQADGHPVDLRSDIFALGIVFHECLTMKRLFRGQSDFETMRLIREARVTPPSQIAPEIPPGLDQVVLRMLARDLRDRYQSCEELLADLLPIARQQQGDAVTLRDFLKELGPIAPRVVIPQPAAVTAVMAAPPDAVIRETRLVLDEEGLKPKHRTLLAVTASAAVLVLFWFLIFGGHDSHKTATVVPTTSASASRPRVTPLPPAGSSRDLPSPSMPTVSASPKPVVRAEPPVPATVHLSLAGQAGAEALLDGKLIGTLPVDVELPRQGGTRHLTVRASGTKPWTRVVAADVDVALKVSLTKLRAEAPRAASSSSSPAPSRRSSSPSSVIKDPFQ